MTKGSAITRRLEPAAGATQLFVLGVARGGSTLVGRVLDLHPRLVCVGEVARVSSYRPE